MEAVWVALVGVGMAVITVMGQWWLKRQDFERQDQVARQVAEVAAAAALTVTKLDEVHVMVNQQRTDMQNYIEQLKAGLVTAGAPVPRDESLQK